MKSPNGRREPQKLREKAYQSFTHHLLAGSILPGQFLSQRELTELTGLPLGAIRELVPAWRSKGSLSQCRSAACKWCTLT